MLNPNHCNLINLNPIAMKTKLQETTQPQQGHRTRLTNSHTPRQRGKQNTLKTCLVKQHKRETITDHLAEQPTQRKTQPKHNRQKRSYSISPYTNHFQHNITLRDLREKYMKHKKTYCTCDPKNKTLGHVQLLLPHKKNILRCELEDKLHDVQNILYKIVKQQYEHWPSHKLDRFIETNIKTAMFYEPDFKYITIHRKSAATPTIKYMIFKTITAFKSDPTNTKNWHWHHDRCVPQGKQMKVNIPKKDRNIYECDLHLHRKHKKEPRGYTRLLKKRQKKLKLYEPKIIPDRKKPEEQGKYYAKINQINLTNWENHLYPTLKQRKKKLGIRFMELILPKFQNNIAQGTIIIQGNNINKLYKQCKYFEQRGFIPEGTKIITTNKREHNMYRCQHNHRKKRATILGCKTSQQASECEQYMMTINNKIHTEYTWHKTWKKQQWVFDIRFQNEHIRNKFIKNWIDNKSENPTPLMIFTRETAYNKLQNHKMTQQIMKQLHLKIRHRVQQSLPRDEANRINNLINQIIPQTTYELPTHRELNEDIFDFINLYNLPHSTHSIHTTDTDIQDQTLKETLRILSKNMGGSLKKKLETESHLMTEILLYQPHMIAIQEHQLNKMKKSTFRKTMQIPGYTLMLHHKARLTDIPGGRPTCGLAIWMYTPMLNTYEVETMKNTHETQIIQLKPKNNYNHNPSIQLANVYYTPTLNNQEYYKRSKQALQATNNPNTIQILVGDLNARPKTTGDLKPNPRGNILVKQCADHHQDILNEMAYGQPTNQASETASSIVDLAIVPTQQTHIWNKMTIGETETNPVVHNSIIIEAILPITLVKAAPEYHYTINYNYPDQYCLRKFLNNLTLPIFKEILQQTTEYLNAEDINTQRHETVLPTIQDVHFALHHITALQIFGLKKVQHNTRNQHRNWENHEEIQDILYNQTLNQKEKTNKLKQTINQLEKEQQGKKRATNRYEDATAMYKKYRKNKQANKIHYPEQIKTDNGQAHDIERGYSKYLGDKLMKAIHAEVPKIPLNTNIRHTPEEDPNPITIPNIFNTIENLNKDKSPGLSGIPVRYYHWGGDPIIQMLYSWFRIMQQYKYIPWNLKLDIKIPFPKFDNAAPRITKQDPSQYRPIALQNSMYKILDGCIKIKLEEHDETHNIIHKNQGGFKKKEGTREHLYVAQTAFHHNSTIYCAFLDLQKAYDSIWRKALITKLEKQYKVPQQTVHLLQAMYNDTWSCYGENQNKPSLPNFQRTTTRSSLEPLTL